MSRIFQAHPNWETLIVGVFSGVIAGFILLIFNGINFLEGSIALIFLVIVFYHWLVKGDSWNPKGDKNP